MTGTYTPEQLHIVAWMREHVAEQLREIQFVDRNHIRITYGNGGMALLTCGRDHQVTVIENDQAC